MGGSTSTAAIEGGDRGPARGRFHWPTFAGDALLVSGGGLVANVLNYVFHFAISRELGPDAYGSLATLLAISMVAGVIGTSVGTVAMQGTARLWALHHDDAIASFGRGIVRASVRAGVVVALACLALAWPLSKYLHITDSIAWFALAASLLTGIVAACVRGAIQGAHRFRAYAASLVGETATKLALGFALVVAGFSVGGAMIGVALGLIAGIAIAIAALGRTPTRDGDPRTRSAPLGSATWRLVVIYAASMALLFVDTLFAKHALAGTEAGYYTAAGLVARILPFGIGLVVPLVTPKAVAARHTDRSALARLLLVTFSFALGGTIVMLAVFELWPATIIDVTFGSTFAHAAPLLQLYAVDASLIALGALGSSYLAAVGEYAVGGWLCASVAAQAIAMALYGSTAHALLTIAIAGNALVLPAIATLVARSIGPAPQAPVPGRAETMSSEPERA